MEEIIVPFFGMLFSLGAPAVIVWQFIASRHRERMMVLERGLDASQYAALFHRQRNAGDPSRALKWALLLSFCGGGLWYGSWLVQVYNFPEATSFAMVLIGGGIALICYYIIASRKQRSKPQEQGNN